MKKTSIILLLTFIICLTFLTACNKTDATDNSLQTTSDTSAQSAQSTTTGKAIGGYRNCELHHQDYHLIPGQLIEYIGEERFYEWTELDDVDQKIPGCESNKTVYNCIQYFNVERSALEEIYSSIWDSWVWDIDALCDKDISASDQFYRNNEYIDSVHEKRADLRMVKIKIFKANYDEWTAIYGNFVPSPKHSMKYLIELLDISRSELEGFIKAAGGQNTYSYNLDVLYPTVQQGEVNVNSVGNAPESDLTPIEEDALFCGIDDWHIE